MTPALACHGLRVSLGGREVLQGLGLSLPAGRWTAVAGPNGAGKTTLLKALAGLLPARGEVRWLGRDPSLLPARGLRAPAADADATLPQIQPARCWSSGPTARAWRRGSRRM